MRNYFLLTGLLILTGTIRVQSQDRFPTPIPLSDIAVSPIEFAIIPDSSAGLPPRISLLTQDPSGRLFVSDQRGPLYTIDDSGMVVMEYLDIRDFPELDILSHSEAGLIAFNPTITPTDPDYGNLYIGLGDGGLGDDPQENGEDPSNPYAALLRIDPLGTDGINGYYGIVPENLLASDGDPNTLGEIYAYGLRNPQRYGWDLATGNLFIADIGQRVVEEINLGQNGANYGWDIREASFFSRAAMPLD